MIDAERILLSHALKDPFNERFVFVSDRYTSRLFLKMAIPSSGLECGQWVTKYHFTHQLL
jgi:hypothetical protein